MRDLREQVLGSRIPMMELLTVGGKCDQDSPKWAQGAQQISRSGKAQSGDCGWSISNHVDERLRDCIVTRQVTQSEHLPTPCSLFICTYSIS
jgi:hypothetical protein